MAGSTAICMSGALGAEYGLATLLGADSLLTVVLLLLGAVVPAMGMMGLFGSTTRAKLRIAVFFPFAIGTGLVIGVTASVDRILTLAVLVVVLFVAVFVRRFGIPFFIYGFMGWMGYFFASLMHATWPMVPLMLLAAALSTAVTMLLSTTVLRTNPRRSLARSVRAFDARARAVARAITDLLEAEEHDQRLRRRLRRNDARLAEAALMVEAWSGEHGALPPEQSPALLRRRLLDAQQSIDRMVTAAESLRTTGTDQAATAAQVANLLALRDDTEAERTAYRLAAAGDEHDDGRSGWWAARHFASAAIEFVDIARAHDEGVGNDEADREHDEFAPVVGLMMGNLPGSPATASAVPARGHRWNPLARLDMNTRQAIQVSLAAAIALTIGSELSTRRYYWAVLAVFLMFTGTATRSETFIKGWNRVLGTLVGLGASIWFAELTAAFPHLIPVVVVLAITCGLYLMRISYAFMIFFVTIALGQLYSALHEFSPGLLVLRLEETAIGAGIGLLVALVVTPLSTSDTVRTARDNFLDTLAGFCTAAARSLDPAKPADETELNALSRTLDDRLRQLLLVAKPLMRRLLWNTSPARLRRRVALYANTATHARALATAVREHNTLRQDGLAAAARALATAARELSKVSVLQPQPSAVDPLAAADAALFGRTAGARATDPALRALTHLHQLLRELAEPESGTPPYTRPGNLVLGQVHTADGEPLAARITLMEPTGRELAHATTSADTGYYRIQDCPAGQYLAVATSDGREPAVRRLQVFEHAPAALEFTLDEPSPARTTLRGTVLGSDGLPVPHATVAVLDPAGAPLTEVRTDTNGAYRVELGPRAYTALAGDAAPTKLDAGAANELTLRLRESGRVQPAHPNVQSRTAGCTGTPAQRGSPTVEQ